LNFYFASFTLNFFSMHISLITHLQINPYLRFCFQGAWPKVKANCNYFLHLITVLLLEFHRELIDLIECIFLKHLSFHQPFFSIT
jgi:hypothetical protein